MSPWKSASLCLAALTFTACSGDSNPVVVGGPAQGLFYEYPDQSCPAQTTGRQQFNSPTELCLGLQNNSLNNNCALQARANHFMQACQGQQFSPYDGQMTPYDPNQTYDPNYPNNPYDPSLPNFPDQSDPLDPDYSPLPQQPSYPANRGGRAEVNINGFQNLNYRLDARLNLGTVDCYTENRQFHLVLEHPQLMNRARLLHLKFNAGNQRTFPNELRVRAKNPESSLNAFLLGVDAAWSPRRESCEVAFTRQNRLLEASFDCRLDSRTGGRGQTIRMQVNASCRIEKR